MLNKLTGSKGASIPIKSINQDNNHREYQDSRIFLREYEIEVVICVGAAIVVLEG